MSFTYEIDTEDLHKNYPKELPDDFENNKLKIFLLRIYTRNSYKFLISKTYRRMREEIWRINNFFQCRERIIPIEILQIENDDKIFKNTIYEIDNLYEVSAEVYYQFILFKRNLQIKKQFINKNYHINIEDEFYYKDVLTRDEKENEYWDSYYYYENIYYEDIINDADSEVFYFKY